MATYLVAPPSLPADGHRAAQREEVGQLGQRQEAEAGAEADEAAEGGCGEHGGGTSIHYEGPFIKDVRRLLDLHARNAKREGVRNTEFFCGHPLWYVPKTPRLNLN